jgi:TolB-like protein/Flp pilus assembly protein TadD
LSAVCPAATAWSQCPDGSPPPCHAPVTPKRGVAVLYFENLSGDSTYAYLADGLTEELILKLGNVRQLDVRSRFAVRRYKNQPPADPQAAARALNVAYLVTGSVRPGKDRVRVTVEVVRASTGARIWGGELDRSSADLLAVTDDVARVVAQGIVGRLAPAEAAALASRATTSPEAYEHFLRGNFAMALRTPKTALQALDEYQAALQLDPAYTAALARTVYGYTMLLVWGWHHPTLPPESLVARGAADAERALRQDSTSSDAWMAEGMLLWFLEPRTLRGALAAHERSVALDPGNAEAWHLLGVVNLMLGRDSAATDALRHALAIEPGRPVSLERLAELVWEQHDAANAMRLLDTLIALTPGFYSAYSDRVALLLRLGDTASARRDAELCAQLGPDDYVVTRATLAWVQAAEGDTGPARRGMDSVMAQIDNPNGVGAWWVSNVVAPFISLGDSARALEIVERSQPRGPLLWWQLRWPALDPIRESPRFQRVVEESRALAQGH